MDSVCVSLTQSRGTNSQVHMGLDVEMEEAAGVGDAAGGVANPERPDTIEAGRMANRERPQMMERRLNSDGDCGRGTDEHRGDRKPQPH